MYEYYPFTEWECFQHGMWTRAETGRRAELLALAVGFTGDHEEYGRWMMKVVAEWPITMKQHLLRGSNDLAHIGHCAACMAHGLPEYITREAWGMLSPEQQDSANARAMEALDVYQATSFAQHASEAFQLEMWPHYDARG